VTMNTGEQRSALFAAHQVQAENILQQTFPLLSRFSDKTKEKRSRYLSSVPTRRLFELHSDRLARIGDFNPLAVGFPAFGDDLNQDFAERRVRNVCDTFAVGLHVEFDFFVFAKFSLFDVLQIDAGVFHGRVGVATDDFNANAIRLRLLGSSGAIGRRTVLRRSGRCEPSRKKETSSDKGKGF